LQPLFISVFSKADGKTVKHDSEGTGYGWKDSGLDFPARFANLPTSCIMERP